jgi:YidC/Oxa1 family membrane protein insertase
MNRKTVLAFVLIFVVYLAGMKAMDALHKPAPVAPGGQAGGAANTAASEAAGGAASDPAASGGDASPAAGAASVAGGTAGWEEASGAGETAPAGDPLRFLAPDAAPAPVEVRSDLYALRIDPRGAVPVSWEGLAFKGPQGDGAVQLIPPEALSPGGADAVLGSRGRLDLGQAVFVPDAPGPLLLERGGSSRTVVFTARTEGGVIVRKSYTFHPGRYDIDVQMELAGQDAAGVELARRAVGDDARARFGWPAGIASTERNSRGEDETFRAFAGVGADLVTRPRRAARAAAEAEKVRATVSGSVRFAGVQNKYFAIAGIVSESREKAVEGEAHLDADFERRQQTWRIDVPLVPGRGDDGRAGAARLALYLGPSDYELLKSYGVGLEKIVDLGWKMIQPISAFILWLMGWMYKVVPNYGLVIILLSVVTKVAFYPLTLSSTRSMKRLQEVQPRLKALQEKHKNNQQKLGEEMMKLYKEERINPMGGCLPLLLQMPVFFALYQVLRSSIALRQAPFVGWIDDLGQPDALFNLPFSLPFLGNEFNLLPLLMAASTYWQMKVTPTAPSTGPSLQLMNKLMPFMMLFFFYHFPSGLVIYWTVINLLSIYQTWHIHRTTPAVRGAQA